MKIITNNRKAYHDYEISQTIEAGIVLTGDEAKSIRSGGATLTGAFAHVRDGELYLMNMHIAAYKKAFLVQEAHLKRARKLLLHKRELTRLIGDVSRKGVTLVPLKLYFNDRNIIKVEIGIAKHKKAPAKKQHLKERDIRRETARELRIKL